MSSFFFFLTASFGLALHILVANKNWVARMRQMVCLAGLFLLTLDTAAGFSMAGVPRVVRAHKASVGRRGAPRRPRVCAMASSSTADDPTKRPITKLRLIQHKAEAFWFYR